jgi:hypothetical protein
VTPQERIFVERACERLSLEFARCNDNRQYERLSNLFCEDGIFRRPLSPDRPLQGREAILAAMKEKPLDEEALHVCTNVLIDVTTDDLASGLTYFTVYVRSGHKSTSGTAPSAASTYVGTYSDEFVRTDAGWRIRERVGSLRFVVPRVN